MEYSKTGYFAGKPHKKIKTGGGNSPFKTRTMRYKQNLKVEGNKVYSYNTHVATIEGTQLIQLGWWSVTTQKHINYIAKEYQLGLIKIK